MLILLYEIVDWLYFNLGLGCVFDWGGDVVGYYDCKGDIVCYDFLVFGGLMFNIFVGCGDVGIKSFNYFGVVVYYNVVDIVMFYVGYENNFNFKYDYKIKDIVGKDVDNIFLIDVIVYIVGFELFLFVGFGLVGVYKYIEGVFKIVKG